MTRKLPYSIVFFAGLCAIVLIQIIGPDTASAGEPIVSLDFSTYFGGSGDEGLRETVIDSNNNIIVIGHGDSPRNQFPTAKTIGPGGSSDIYVAKFSPVGQLLWVTIIGGTGVDRGYGIDMDGSGDIYIAGQTSSTDFPTTTGAWDIANNGGGCLGPHGCNLDAYVLKLRKDGTALEYSTYLGGSKIDGARGGLAADNQGYAYIAGYTGSADFLETDVPNNPAKVNSYRGGASDGFVTKINRNGSGIVYSRYLGGSNDTVNSGEVVVGVAVDAAGNAHAHAIVRSDDAAVVNAYDPVFNLPGPSDAYFAKISPDGKSLLYATYFGGNGAEFGEHRMVVDSSGYAYFAGVTTSTNFPTINAHQPGFGGNSDGYLVKVRPDGQPVFSTYIGGGQRESAFGPMVSPAGNIYISGPTESDDFEVTTNALYSTRKSGREAMLQIYNPSGQLLYSTYFGGSGDDYPRWGGVDGSGNAIIAGATSSANFPLKNPHQSTHKGKDDMFLAKFTVSFTTEMVYLPVIVK